jgi:hypothetical protein
MVGRRKEPLQISTGREWMETAEISQLERRARNEICRCTTVGWPL